MGSSSSTSSSSNTNITSTTTSTFANAFNNALNTTQNFSNIGGYTPAQAGDPFSSFNYTWIFAGAALLFAALIFLKRK